MSSPDLFSRPSAPADPSSDGSDASPQFPTALRGYDRRQVDDHLSAVTARNVELQGRVEAAESRLAAAESHAAGVESEVRELRKKTPDGSRQEDGFGFRAEKLLRLAESEASEVRAHAAREAAQLLEAARAEAETHRHDVEQTLITRASVHEQQAAQRTAELQEREQVLADQVEAARAEVADLRAAAARHADELRTEAESRAAEIRSRAEEAAERRRGQSTQELNRLSGLQDTVLAELARMQELLGRELSGRSAGSSDAVRSVEATRVEQIPDQPDRRPSHATGSVV